MIWVYVNALLGTYFVKIVEIKTRKVASQQGITLLQLMLNAFGMASGS
jgi:hypothetical protein